MLDQALAERGDMPLPPYIAGRRSADERDRSDYQTMFAREEGSVAAPTAGLHFTDAIVETLQARGIGLHKVTLHVGPGTFLPVKAEDTSAHKMQPESGSVGAETAAALNAARVPAAASSPSARRRCGCSKARRPRTAPLRLFPARLRCSSRPATASAPSTSC